MSTKLKLNVKNISSGLQNFCEIFAGHESKIHHGFSRLVVPRSIPLRRPDCKYYKQDYVRRSTLDFAKLVLSPTSEKRPLKRISLNIPLPGKWLDMVHIGPVYSPGYGFPWESTYSFHYESRNPQSPTPDTPERYPGDGKGSNRKANPICPDTPRPPPMKDDSDHNTKPKTTRCCCPKLCTFTIPLNYRFFSTKSCTPKGGGGGKSKCPPDDSKGCKPPKRCGSKKQKKSKCDDGSKRSACPPPKKCASKGKGSGCPPVKQVKDCAPKRKAKSRCPPQKKTKGCPPKRSQTKGKDICGGKKRAPPKCSTKAKRKSSSKCSPKKSAGDSSCRPVLKKPRTCEPKKSSTCEPKGKPKKPKC